MNESTHVFEASIYKTHDVITAPLVVLILTQDLDKIVQRANP